jgi:predicted ATPase
MTEDAYRFDMLGEASQRFIVLSGCSGGGKSTLLAALQQRGFAVCDEPGRQIVKEQHFIGGPALPWSEPRQFVELCVSRAMHQMALAARVDGLVFFDRGIVDAVGALEHIGTPIPTHLANAAARLRYHRQVFMAPPWPEIFTTDAERKHGFDAALASYAAQRRTYERLGYTLVDLPRTDVAARVQFILDVLGFANREGAS